jgi:glutamyl-tRNA reductase
MKSQLPFVFGLNYSTSGFEVREKLAFSREEIPSVLHRLQSSGITREIVILSTCNRTEIFCITHDIDFVINAICDIQNVCPRTVKKHSYVYSGEECANHLFRVVSGLESMVLGETEIVAQVKDAINLATDANSIGTMLLSVFQMALAVEKDVRNATAINNIAISMGHALVNLVAVNFESLDEEKILFLGAGDMMQQLAPHFKNIKLAKKTIINRTLAKAELLSKRLGADYADFMLLPDLINNYSIIIACLGGQAVILNEEILKARLNGTRLMIIDLSMPLITSLELRKYSNITVLTIDDIAKIVDVGLEKRKIAALEANNIINSKLVEYQNWLKKRGLTPVIRALRDNADEIRQEVLTVAQKQLENGESPDDVLKAFSIKLTNRLLHGPTVNLCASEDKLQEDLAGLITYLYDLEIQAN